MPYAGSLILNLDDFILFSEILQKVSPMLTDQSHYSSTSLFLERNKNRL